MTFEELKEECLKCTKCSLHKTRTNVVFGVGKEDADVMFIGEGPGKTEDETGEPFTGRSGKLLTDYLIAVGLKREDVYIANIVKCRPPENRDPSEEEQELCIEYLRQQIRFIKPKIIVCLGRISACRLIDSEFKVTRQHGEFFEKKGFLMMGTYHPSALLRNSSLKEDAFDDFKGIVNKLKELR